VEPEVQPLVRIQPLGQARMEKMDRVHLSILEPRVLLQTVEEADSGPAPGRRTVWLVHLPFVTPVDLSFLMELTFIIKMDWVVKVEQADLMRERFHIAAQVHTEQASPIRVSEVPVVAEQEANPVPQI